MKKTIVISLGGSLIVPKEMDIRFLKRFKKVLQKNYKNYKFVVVCGGGTIARKYISALKSAGKSKKILSEAGIRATRENARFMINFFGKESNDTLPMNMEQVKANLSKNSVVFCGALRFTKNSTSDTTAAKLAKFIKTPLVNLTNVKGLFSSDPKKFKNAKFIPKISWEKFYKMAASIKYEAGQNFVLDQNASGIIKRYQIPCYIMGKDLSNLQKLLNNKSFTGTTIAG